MQLVVEIRGFLGHAPRFGVGSNRILPVADAGENVRRHVLRVCRRGRHLGVASSGRKPVLRERGRIIKVDQIMGDSGMLRLTRPNLLQNCRSLKLIGISLVGRRRRDVESQCVIDLGFIIMRIALRQLVHRLEVGQNAGAMVDLVVVGVHSAKRIDIIALALGLGVRAFALCKSGSSLREVFSGWGDVRIVQQAQSNAPIGDGAFRIGLQGVLKGLLRSPVPERVLIQHRLIELLLRLRFARCLKVDLA